MQTRFLKSDMSRKKNYTVMNVFSQEAKNPLLGPNKSYSIQPSLDGGTLYMTFNNLGSTPGSVSISYGGSTNNITIVGSGSSNTQIPNQVAEVTVKNTGGTEIQLIFSQN